MSTTISNAALGTVNQALLQLEKTNGYIPGGDASVQYNCFAFVSDVCEKLYGVTYKYEQQNGNYQFNHSSNYYTVATKTFSYSSDTNVRKAYAAQIRDWMLDNAAEGDIIQYGCADPSYSKRHTVLLQYIDDEKIQVLHSNYQTNNIAASAVRVDTIYWSKFIADPNHNLYSGDSIVSLNLLFGSQMKLEGGFGISINRYSKLSSKYQLVKYDRYIPTITSTERSSSTSIKVKWDAISGAQYTSVEFKAANDKSWKVATSNAPQNYFDVKGLTMGVKYSFRVRVFANNAWQKYSKTVSKTALPPKVGAVGIVNTTDGVLLNWNTRGDITGCVVLKGVGSPDNLTPIATIDKAAGAYLDNDIAVGQAYYYAIQRFYSDGVNVIYGEASNPVSTTMTIGTPANFNVVNNSKSSVKLSWSQADLATMYAVDYTDKKTNTTYTVELADTSTNITNLTVGRKYEFSVRAINQFGSSSSSPRIELKLKPKKTSISAISSTKSSVKLSWSKTSEAAGYKVYRSTKKGSGYKLVKTVKGNKSFTYTDKKLKSNKKYYYKVKAYVKSNGKEYTSDYSAVKSIKTK